MSKPNSATPRLCTPADPTAVKPTEAEVADAIEDAYSGWVASIEAGEDVTDTEYEAMARAALALFAGQPTVAQVKAESLREAAQEFWARLPDGTGNGRMYNSYRVAGMLRDRADQIVRADR